MYKLVLGLEIHIHVKTTTGMFCGCVADFYNAKPNTHVCPVCLGLPGALPVPNNEAIRKTQLLGLALNCEINKKSNFDRKHYFYPDLPKGYQISQYQNPLCLGGYLELELGKKIELDHIHLEEDTAKSMHVGGKTLIDFNKSGTALIEIVTKPVFTSVEEAVEFCKKIQTIIRFIDVGEGDMEKGQMRLEANISMRTEVMEKNNILPGYKVEIKNINSFRFMERAVKAEIKRQSELLESGGIVQQENRGFDEDSGLTVSQRSKEEAHDYRYFPEPDIPPMLFDDRYIDELKKVLPELPQQLVDRYVHKFGVSKASASTLVYSFSKEVCQKYEAIVKEGINPVKALNYLLNKKEFQELTVSEFIDKLKSENDKVSDTNELTILVDKIIKDNPKAVQDYKKGNIPSLEFLVGMGMRETKGKADVQKVRELLIKKLL